MSKQMRRNANVNVGDIVSISGKELPIYQKLKILPFDSDLEKIPKDTDIFTQYIVPFFKEKIRPVTVGDCFVLKPAQPNLEPVEFKVVLTEPPQAVLIQQGSGEIFFDGNPVSREEDDAERRDKIGYSDLGGIDKEIGLIREMVELPLKHPILFSNLGIKPPRGVLLHGPPGCGKSSIGRAISNEIGAKFILVNGPEIISGMAGDSEKMLR